MELLQRKQTRFRNREGIGIYGMIRVMKGKEKQSMVSAPSECLLRKKLYIIDYMIELAERYSISLPTVFTGLNYFDRVMAEYTGETATIMKVAVMCLLLACKYEERIEDIPHFSVFCNVSHPVFSSLKEMSAYEQSICSKLQFHLCCITASHYIELYLYHGVVFKTDSCDNHAMNHRLVVHMNEMCDYVLRLTLLDAKLYAYAPSLQAASIVYVARKYIRITPLWRKELEEMTCYRKEELMDCSNVLVSILMRECQAKSQSVASPMNMDFVYVC